MRAWRLEACVSLRNLIAINESVALASGVLDELEGDSASFSSSCE